MVDGRWGYYDAMIYYAMIYYAMIDWYTWYIWEPNTINMVNKINGNICFYDRIGFLTKNGLIWIFLLISTLILYSLISCLLLKTFPFSSEAFPHRSCPYHSFFFFPFSFYFLSHFFFLSSFYFLIYFSFILSFYIICTSYRAGIAKGPSFGPSSAYSCGIKYSSIVPMCS